MSLKKAKKTIRRRTGGRSAKVRDAVLQATIEALAEHGPSGLKMNEIARRSGVHAASIQRRWGSLENVLVDTVLSYSQQMLPIPDTGSLRGDLTAFGKGMVAYLETPLGEAIVRTMSISEDDPALGAKRAEILRVRFETASVMIERAKNRGELRAEIDPQIVLELLNAPLQIRKLLFRYPIDHAYVESVVDMLLRGLNSHRSKSQTAATARNA